MRISVRPINPSKAALIARGMPQLTSNKITGGFTISRPPRELATRMLRMTRRTLTVNSWLVLCISITGQDSSTTAQAQISRVGQSGEVDFRPKQLMPPKPPFKQLTIKPKSDGDKLLKPDELIVGVTINGESRAYPLNMIKGPEREVINDSLGGTKILTTWCSLCFTNVVFDRTVNGEVLEFGVAGMLWNNNMVLYDSGTNSLWSQMLGQAMQGPLKAEQLQRLPSTITSWSEWTKRFPETTVVLFNRTATANRVKNYKASKSLVIGIPEDEGKVWYLSEIRRLRVVNDVWKDTGIVLVYSEASGGVELFRSDLGADRLDFTYADGKFQDRETGSTWDPLTGKAVAGSLAGKRLEKVNSVICFIKTWRKFFPAR